MGEILCVSTAAFSGKMNLSHVSITPWIFKNTVMWTSITIGTEKKKQYHLPGKFCAGVVRWHQIGQPYQWIDPLCPFCIKYFLGCISQEEWILEDTNLLSCWKRSTRIKLNFQAWYHSRRQSHFASLWRYFVGRVTLHGGSWNHGMILIPTPLPPAGTPPITSSCPKPSPIRP